MNMSLAISSDFDPGQFALDAIENDPKLQDSTKAQYKRAVENYLGAGHSLTDPAALAKYANAVGSSTRAFLGAAVKRLAKEVEQYAKMGASPENIASVQAAVFQAQALQGAIKTEKHKGQKAHTWLSQTQVKDLLTVCEKTPANNAEYERVTQRDRLAIGLLVAAGLRRAEACALTFEAVKLQPVGDKMRTVLDVKGKGAKSRVVPISDKLANAISDWGAVVGGAGRILRSLGRSSKKEPGQSMTTTALYNLVQKRGKQIGFDELQPHDLRRTYAQLGLKAGVPIDQISTLLGHANIATTQRYLNIELDLSTTISDFVPFG